MPYPSSGGCMQSSSPRADGKSLIVTGSANATDAAFGGDVEVVASLIGPAGAAVDAALDGDEG